MSIRKFKIDKSELHKPSNYIDVYNCPVCMMLDNKCSMCDDEYQCQECEIIEKEMNDAFKYAN